MIMNPTTYCYCILNNRTLEKLEYHIHARDALRSMNDYRVYSCINKDTSLWRVPFLPFGKGDASEFINLGDTAGYVPRDITARGSGCMPVADRIFCIINTDTFEQGKKFYADLFDARIARNNCASKYDGHFAVYRAHVVDVNIRDEELDTRYFERIRNINGLDYIIRPDWDLIY